MDSCFRRNDKTTDSNDQKLDKLFRYVWIPGQPGVTICRAGGKLQYVNPSFHWNDNITEIGRFWRYYCGFGSKSAFSIDIGVVSL